MTEIREALTSAFQQSDTSETSPPAEVEAGPPIEAVGTDDTPPPGEVPSDATSSAPAAAPLKDPKTGQFLKRGTQPAVPTQKPVVTPLAAPVQPKGTAEAPAVADAPKLVTPASKAPQSWKPDVREKWATLPPEVQAEVTRLDREVRQTMQTAAEARKGWDSFREVVGPYEALIRAEGGEPLKAVGSLLQTAAALRTAPPAIKARLVAGIIQQYGVPVDVLDAALSGQAPAAQPQNAPQQFDPEALIQQAQQRFAQQLQAQHQQAINTKAQQDTEAFVNGGGAEFLEDVRGLMANLLDAAGRSGIPLSLQEAYDRACSIHPEVSKVVEQRRQAQTATATQAATQRARAAASSVKTQPAGLQATSEPNTVRGALEASIARLSGR